MRLCNCVDIDAYIHGGGNVMEIYFTQIIKAFVISSFFLVGMAATNVSYGAEVIYINLEKPSDTLHKTDNLYTLIRCTIAIEIV